jgi:hypothetical protein
MVILNYGVQNLILTVQGATFLSKIILVEYVPTELGLLDVEILCFNQLLILYTHLSRILSILNQFQSGVLRVRVVDLGLSLLFDSLEVISFLILVLEPQLVILI